MESFMTDSAEQPKSKAQCAGELSRLLKMGEKSAALTTVRAALDQHPSDPYFASYYGCLLATVERRPADGVRLCEDAIKMLRHAMPEDKEYFYPIFYLNLGKAYLGANKKTDALDAFQQGLKYDPKNSELHAEMNKIGRRRRQVISFLDRSHPLNRYLGMLRHRMTR
jgi:tetratricopeptide (TPR) repeat protein